MSKLLDRLDELEKAATPGPWTATRYQALLNFESGDVVVPPESPDAEFITELRNAYPKLRAVVKAAHFNLQRWVEGEHSEQDVDLYKALAALDTSSTNQDKG